MSTRIKEYSYIDRAQLDSKITRLLARDTHIALKGASKSGKSWLRQKCISDAIVVQCRLGMTVEDIYKNALSSIGVPFNTSTTRAISSSGELSGQTELSVPFFVKSQFDGAVNIGKEKSVAGNDFHCSINNLQFVSSSILNSKKRLIVEDFHYLSIPERQRLAHDLKTLWDYGCYIVIIGVWTQTNLLTSLNPDITGRIEEVSVLWSDEDLHKVIAKGSHELNIQIAPDIQRTIIKDSFGNVGILQILLLRLVEDECNIIKSDQQLQCITNPELLDHAARAYADQLDGRYQQFAKLLSSGIRKRKKSTGIYAYAMEAIVSATNAQLINGFSRDEIYRITNAKQPRIQKGNLKTILGKLVELQEPERGNELVISYDETVDAIFVVDLQLLFYRKYHTMKWPWEEMVEEAEEYTLFEPEEAD